MKQEINLFLLVFNGQHPRFDETMQELLKIFRSIFGEDIWNTVALVFTGWEGDSKSIKQREQELGPDPENRRIPFVHCCL